MDSKNSPRRRRRRLTVDEYFSGVRSGNVAVLAQALTLVESNNADHEIQGEQLLTRLLPHTGNAIRVGITGAPGAGKSTFIEALGLRLIRGGAKVAVLAVDPSSDVSGGSILGDKTRMPELAAEPTAFIRPSPTSGTLGGVARKTREAIFVCEGAGFDTVLVETVGVGQSETMVSHMTDCFLTLMLPGAGDELQGIKRGLLELVDVIAVNKADGDTRSAAELAARQYEDALTSLAGSAARHDLPRVFTCSALMKQGIEDIWSAIEQGHAQSIRSGQLASRRKQQNLHWLWALVEEGMRKALQNHPDVTAIRDELERNVVAGTIPAEAAARKLLETFGIERDHY